MELKCYGIWDISEHHFTLFLCLEEKHKSWHKSARSSAHWHLRLIYFSPQDTVFNQILVCCLLYFSGNSSEYRIDGAHVTFAKYMEALEKIGILTKAQNCLVFQVKYPRVAVHSVLLKISIKILHLPCLFPEVTCFVSFHTISYSMAGKTRGKKMQCCTISFCIQHTVAYFMVQGLKSVAYKQ